MTQPNAVNMGWLQNEAARIAQQQAQREQAMGTKDFYNLESEYVTYFRIAPPWSPAGAFGRPIGQHYGIPGSRAGNKGNLCLANWPSLSLQCPLCAVYEKLYEDSPKKSPPKEEAYQSKRREYFYVNAFIIGRSPRVNKGTEDVPQWVDGAFEPMQEDPLRCRIVRLSPKSFNYYVTQYWQTKVDFTNVHEGVLCMITVIGKGKATRYTENMAGSQGIEGFQPQQSRLFESEEHITHAVSTINDLDAIWKPPDDVAVQEISQLAYSVSSRWGQQVGVPTVAGAATLPGAIQQPLGAAPAAPALPAPGVLPSPALPPAPGTLALPAPLAPPPQIAAPQGPAGVVPPVAPATPVGTPAQVTAPPLPPGAAAPALSGPPPAPPVTPPAVPATVAPPVASGAPAPPAVPATVAPPVTAPVVPAGAPPAPTPPAGSVTMAPPPPAPPAAGAAAPAPVAPGPAPTPEVAPTAPAPAAPVGEEKPEGSPDCYGQNHIISNHEDPTVRVKCQGCHWSTMCEISPANMALKAAG